MKHSILVALSESIISLSVLDYLINLGLDKKNLEISLVHIFRRPAAEEKMMGKKFVAEQQPKMISMLENAKTKLMENGFNKEVIKTNLVTEQYPTVADGIIDQFKRGNYNMVMIGRKKMSKSEEFVLGDISIKLVRALEGGAVIVVKTK